MSVAEKPTFIQTGHHNTEACDYSNRNADLGSYQARSNVLSQCVTVLEHVHSRQFWVTDAHLPGRGYAIQIGGDACGRRSQR
jgi:hypothetical protein